MATCCVCNKPSSSVPESLIQCLKCKLSVHKECYGIASQYPTADQWMCQRCRLGAGNERCDLCPFSDGALKKTDNGSWAHILCAQYIPEVIFGNNYSMEPINLAEVPRPRFQQVCYICDDKGDHIAKRQGACMQCNVQNCINCFHVTCGQKAGLLVAEDCDNRRIVDYYGFCSLHVKHSKNSSVKLTEPKYSSSSLKLSSCSFITTNRDKLPAVDTLSSKQLEEVTKLLPNINNVPAALTLDTTSSNIKPMQPKVRACPIPFQGVHKQTNISISSEIQPTDGTVYTAQKDTTLTTSNTASSNTSNTSTPVVERKRKSSSSTETADSEELGSEPIVKIFQSIVNLSGKKSMLKITKQNANNDEASDETYNDLSDLFGKKVKKKKYKSPDSEYSDYMPYTERRRNSLLKKGKRTKCKKDPFKIRSKVQIKSPKYGHNSYLYKSPPKTPIKIQTSKLVTGDKGYSPTSIVSKMIEETKEGVDMEYKPCTGKPLMSVDAFFDRFKEMGMQYIVSHVRNEKSSDMLKELQGLNQVNSFLKNKLKAKSARLEHMRKLNARLSVPYTNPMKSLPEPAPMSAAIAKLLATIHDPPNFHHDTILAETWLDAETVQREEEEEEEKKEEEPEQPVKVEEVSKIPVPATMTALVEKTVEKPVSPNTAAAAAAANKQIPSAAEIPQIIIAGDPPMAYTYKDGSLVGYNPDTLQSSVHYNKVVEDQYKVIEQHYKEKISVAYFEAQRRHYQGLLQHQIQTKLQSNDYLAQAYLTEPWNSGYYYTQQPGRQMPSLTPHFPPTSSSALPQAYSTLPSRPSTSRPQ